MKIAIVGAMHEEIKPLVNQLPNSVVEQKSNKKFYINSLGNNEVIILECGVGKVNAAIGTTILKEVYKAEYIINIGSAGGFDSSLDIGDIVISSEVRYHDVDLTPFGYEFGQMSKMPSFYIPDKKLMNTAIKAAATLNFKTKQGLIASGDTFIHAKEHVVKIQEKFPHICAADMEACAIAHVCHLFKTPFLIIRSISDVVNRPNNKQSYEDFLHIASQKSASLILEMMKLIDR